MPKAERAAWLKQAMEAAGGADLHSLIELWRETREIDRLVARLRQGARRGARGHQPLRDGACREEAREDAPGRRGQAVPRARHAHPQGEEEQVLRRRRCYERAGLGTQWESLVGEIRAEHHRKIGFMPGFEAVVAGARPSARPTFLERAKARWSTPPRN